MKKVLILVLVFGIHSTTFAQLLKLQSADSLNGKPTKEFYTTAWIKFTGFYDTQGIPNESAMHLPSIPTDGSAPDPQFHANLYQSRIILASRYQTKKLGEISSYIETDFYGNGVGGLRLRHAYVRFKNFRIGQTWSGFTDEEAWPNITDFDGPSTGVWVRSAQIGYFIRPSKNQDILISVETPLTDYGRYLFVDSIIQPALQNVPDLVAHYELRWDKGHVQIAGVGRAISYKNGLSENAYVFGGGLNASGSNTIFGRDKFIWQIAGGTGISRYLVSFGGGGWDAVPNTKGDLLAVPVYGGYLGYQYYFGKNSAHKHGTFSSTLVFGYVELLNPLNVPSNTLLTGSYSSLNVYWNVVGPLNFAIEGIYGTRTDEFLKSGDDLRIQGVMEYRF